MNNFAFSDISTGLPCMLVFEYARLCMRFVHLYCRLRVLLFSCGDGDIFAHLDPILSDLVELDRSILESWGFHCWPRYTILFPMKLVPHFSDYGKWVKGFTGRLAMSLVDEMF